MIEQKKQNPLAGRVSRRLINVHCHLFNFNFIPDNLIKKRAHVREKMLRTPSPTILRSWLLVFGRESNTIDP